MPLFYFRDCIMKNRAQSFIALLFFIIFLIIIISSASLLYYFISRGPYLAVYAMLINSIASIVNFIIFNKVISIKSALIGAFLPSKVAKS